MFHTHPPTPTPGARIKEGILYEFPSIGDLFHYVDHFNDGNMQGSIIIAPEGMYIIRKKVFDKNKIRINEDKFFKAITKVFWNTQDLAIEKYKDKLDKNPGLFYTHVSQDKSYIQKINDGLDKFGLVVDYYSRIQDASGNWVLDTIYLPVYVTEPKK